jgi:hypothetical protein
MDGESFYTPDREIYEREEGEDTSSPNYPSYDDIGEEREIKYVEMKNVNVYVDGKKATSVIGINPFEVCALIRDVFTSIPTFTTTIPVVGNDEVTINVYQSRSFLFCSFKKVVVHRIRVVME